VPYPLARVGQPGPPRRRYVCLQLRHWLRCLELITRSDWNPGEYAEAKDRAVYRVDPLVERSIYHIEPEHAPIFLSQMLCLAEDLVARTPAQQTEPLPQISASTLHRLAPAAAAAVRSTRSIRVATYWMWLDAVVGHDSLGYLPSCSPSELKAFDESLSNDDRMALRKYRVQPSESNGC
jgi:hypothetical protein